MKNWEKIIKNKLEGYEVKPPEGSLADFRKRLDANRNPTKKPTRNVLTDIVTVGVAAACLAIVWIMMQPKDTEPLEKDSLIAKVADKNIVPSQSVLANDSSRNVTSRHSIIRTKNTTKKSTSSRAAIVVQISKDELQQDEQYSIIAELPLTAVDTVTHAQNNESLIADLGKERTYGHSTPLFTQSQKAWIASGGVLTTILGGALLASLGSSDLDYGTLPPFSDPDYQTGNPEEYKDFPIGEADHSMPLKLGLSACWKFSDRWTLISGLEYSRYKSNFKFSLSGTKTQYAHYIGLPVKIDYSIANTRWLEVYIGAGGAIDYCVKATLGGENIKKDGFYFSLQGTGGIQLNVTKHIGIYLEPQISWFMPTFGNTLETYRTEHPISFTISTGLRYTISR